MSADWIDVKLNEIANIIMGQSPKSEYYNTDGAGLPFFQGCSEFGELHPTVKKYCTNPTRVAQKNDVFMSVRAPVGDLNIADRECCIGRGLCAIRSKTGDRFVYYLLKANLDLIQTYGGGTTYQAINKQEVNNLPFHVPPLLIRGKIAGCLSAYDTLIENNTRRIKILEEMAQTIYREWFVNFRFPGQEKQTLVESELGMIPEGWEVKRLGDVFETLESGSRPKGGVDPNERDIPSIGAENILGLGQYDYSKEKYISRDFFESMRRGKIQSGDVLLYKDGAKIGRKSMFRDGFPHNKCCINEHVFILRTNDKCSQNYLYFWLDLPEMTQNIKNLNANAAQPGINQAGVKGLPILLPTDKFLEAFEQICEPVLAELFTLAKKNFVLRRTRGLLLPKLISGELDVSELDIETGA